MSSSTKPLHRTQRTPELSGRRGEDSETNRKLLPKMMPEKIVKTTANNKYLFTIVLLLHISETDTAMRAHWGAQSLEGDCNAWKAEIAT